MNSEEFIVQAKRELLWGTSFMDQFHNQLMALYNNQNFMSEFTKIKEKVGQNEFIYIQKTKIIIKDEIWNNRIPDKYKEFKEIVDVVKGKGCAGTSAYITIYFSLRIMDIKMDKSNLTESPMFRKDEITTISDLDYRKKWPANYRCEDGHYVRSKSEMLIDNWLYSHGICHAYEKAVFSNSGAEQYICDFYVPSNDIYIEFWGLDSPLNRQYQDKKNVKTNFYKTNNYKLIELSDDEIMLIDDRLGEIFR